MKCLRQSSTVQADYRPTVSLYISRHSVSYLLDYQPNHFSSSIPLFKLNLRGSLIRPELPSRHFLLKHLVELGERPSFGLTASMSEILSDHDGHDSRNKEEDQDESDETGSSVEE